MTRPGAPPTVELPSAISMREHQMNVRLDPTESARFERVAQHYGLNPAQLVRMLVKREEEKLGLAPAPPTRRRARSTAATTGRRGRG